MSDYPFNQEPGHLAGAIGQQAATVSSVTLPTSNIHYIFDRIVRDPSVPLERVERVLQLIEEQRSREMREAEELRLREAKAAWANAMVQAQKLTTQISRDMENDQTRSRYASLGQVDAAIRPIYSELGFSITFSARPANRENWIMVVCEISHGGYTREFELPLPADGIGPKGAPVMTKTHAMIGAITYARRALLKMVFNLAEVDDDGNRAAHAPEETISQEQAEELKKLLEDKGRTVEAFCQYAHIDVLEDLPVSRFEAACNYVRTLLDSRKASRGTVK